MKPFHFSAALLLGVAGCAAPHPTRPSMRIVSQPPEVEWPSHSSTVQATASDDWSRKYHITLAALHTVEVGDTYEEFEQKIAPARRAMLLFGNESSTPDLRIKEYYIPPREDGQTFTVFIRNGRIVDYLAVGFKK